MTAPVRRVASIDPAPDVEVRLDRRPGPGWPAAVAAVGGRAEPELAGIDRPARFATALLGGEPAGVGLFVREGAWCAVYGMATAPRLRRRGVARSVLRAGARWAAAAWPTGAGSLLERPVAVTGGPPDGRGGGGVPGIDAGVDPGGAAELFLQVEQLNSAAKRSYAACGFVPSHDYHYRVADTRS